MTAIQPNPLELTGATKLPRPGHTRTLSGSKSPDRSPARKAEFAARELDPLLKSLSPDSTLEALQEINAIRGNQAEQNAIARSISDASEAERELGIRAAVAAKKLKEWTEEVNTWPWPSSQDRAWGAGFVPPTSQGAKTTTYFGSLPNHVVKRYEERLDEIWDAIDTLSMNELKDYVFSSHQPHTRSASGQSIAYGRMRDFTALITATVIQSLPVLANLHILLETWSARLAVLRQIPDLLAALEQLKLGLTTIGDIVNDGSKSRKLTRQELDTGKVMFGNRVSTLGKRVDNLLDLLEGQEDSLPQAWIDSLEDIENKYAEWVAKAEQAVLRNQMAANSSHDRPRTPPASPSKVPLPASNQPSPLGETQADIGDVDFKRQSSKQTMSVVERKPLLEINPKADRGHKRGVSEVSVADSSLSGYSLENAEIIDARATAVLPSPRISVIEHPSPGSKTNVTWMAPKKTDEQNPSPTRPTVLQRASTASMELVPKEQTTEVMLRKSASHDLLSSRKSSASTLQPAINPSTTPSSTVTSPQNELDDPVPKLNPRHILTPLATSPSPSLRVDPLSLKGKELLPTTPEQPPLIPRRSSKRLSIPLLKTPSDPFTPPEKGQTEANSPLHGRAAPVTPPCKIAHEGTFDDRLKTILASMPTKIKLSEGSESESSDVNSPSSSRASSPMPALKLSPVRNGKAGHAPDAQSGIRVYHLKGGKSREAQIKLYVRAVGEHGERLMVRVGGGWADLAEYLREYSLHHGGRGIVGHKLEVAEYPGSGRPQSPVGSLRSVGLPKDSKTVVVNSGFDFDLPERGQAENNELETNPWRPPPVPLVPHPMVGLARTTSPSQDRLRSTTPTAPRPHSRISPTPSTTPTVITTTATGNNYTPLGGAGPVQQNRRAISQTYQSTPSNKAWVEGMINQARAVSGSHSRPHYSRTPNLVTTPATDGNTTTVASPTMSVTTSIVSSKNRGASKISRRLSSWSGTPVQSLSDTPRKRPSIGQISQGSQMSNRPSSSDVSVTTAETSRAKKNDDRRKSMMSLGDVGGIRRVFLRKKSEK